MANSGIGMRKWELDRSDYTDGYGTDTGFREAIRRELADFEHMGERLGIGIVAVPKRIRLDNGTWLTTGWYFETVTVPAGKRPVAEDNAPEPTAEEIEAVAAEKDYDDVTTFDPVTGRD